MFCYGNRTLTKTPDYQTEEMWGILQDLLPKPRKEVGTAPGEAKPKAGLPG